MKIHEGIRPSRRRDDDGRAPATLGVRAQRACAGNRALIRFSNDNKGKY
jgi:hypothetical protein